MCEELRKEVRWERHAQVILSFIAQYSKSGSNWIRITSHVLKIENNTIEYTL